MGTSAAKRGYHHGDLRNALIEAAAELAAKGGPESVTIRAAAREVGVTPTAAYRHFAGHEELLMAAKEQALGALREAMAEEVAARPRLADPVDNALVKLGAIGRGYITFARAEPGLFRTVFSPGGPVLPSPEDRTGTGPYVMLLDMLDELVEVGYLRQDRRPMAELAAWAMVHGLSALLDGPLRDLPEDVRDQAVMQCMIVLGHGLSGRGLTEEQEKLVTKGLAS
ncbi:TetR/AcrR family transcriptional regulator [Actinophytocola sp.]|uniref:TetR/AcrR family transcriptional regulator n=1 Tax=Actinophytocola sp. TaxID=1872138 RepID=UPI002ED695CF